MAPVLTIIIPCYNQGHFLDECITSVEPLLKDGNEILIINDGSTSQNTLVHLRRYEEKGFQVIHQENKGLAEARNTGVHHASGKYILPLDADNKARSEQVKKAVEIMEADSSISVVYGDAEYFGEKKGLWKVGPFNLQKMMISNYIDACALIRKSVFDKMGGYDAKMKSGWEDWEFWVRISFENYSFFYLNEIFFDYRYSNKSMARQLYNNYAKPNYLERYVDEKFPTKMNHEYVYEFYTKRFKKNPIGFLVKISLRAWAPKIYSGLLKRNKIRNGI
jgi:glycosyltransferase involved in cell wall biosynthesis